MSSGPRSAVPYERIEHLFSALTKDIVSGKASPPLRFQFQLLPNAKEIFLPLPPSPALWLMQRSPRHYRIAPDARPLWSERVGQPLLRALRTPQFSLGTL